MSKNIYKEFCKNNQNLKQTAKNTFKKSPSDRDRRDVYACCMLAEAAKEAAKAYFERARLEKSMYYYSKASKWYAKIDDERWEVMAEEIAKIAGRYDLKVTY